MTTKKVITQSLYATPREMSQAQLERAWLGSIYSQPIWCRERMLGGVDQSMFEDQELFGLGLAILRDEAEEADKFPHEILKRLMEKKLIVEFEAMFDALQFLPSLYRLYCEELQSRKTAKWIP